jgi:hypothetical protein
LVDSMPKEAIPLTQPTNSLKSWLDKNKIKITDEGLDFSRSKWKEATADQGQILRLYDELFPAQAKGQLVYRTPEEIRTMRQVLFKRIKDNVNSKEPFSDDVTPLIQEIRKQLLEPLGELSDEFKVKNKNYAVTTNAIERFMKYAGGHFTEAFMKGDDLAADRMAELLRRSMSASPARTNSEFASLRRAAAETGLKEKEITDPRRLMLLGQTLEDLFDMPRETSFKEQSAKGFAEGASKLMQGTGALKDLAVGNVGSAVVRGASLFKGDAKLRAQRALRKMLEDGLDQASTIPPIEDVIK